MLLDRWFVSKQRIFLSCDVEKVVDYYRGIFIRHLYLNYWNVFSWNKNHEMHHKMQWNAIPRYSFMMWRHRCKQRRVALETRLRRKRSYHSQSYPDNSNRSDPGSGWRTNSTCWFHEARVVPPTTSRLTPRNAGLLDGAKIGPPTRTRVTPGNTAGVGNTIVG